MSAEGLGLSRQGVSLDVIHWFKYGAVLDGCPSQVQNMSVEVLGLSRQGVSLDVIYWFKYRAVLNGCPAQVKSASSCAQIFR